MAQVPIIEGSAAVAGLVGFTEITRKLGAADLVEDLNSLFSRFDALAKEYGVEKVKTIGDAYLVVAGIIGKHKYVYDVWGATVNHASRYETYSLPGHIHVSDELARSLMDKFDCQSRGVLQMRSIGEVESFFLKGRR